MLVDRLSTIWDMPQAPLKMSIWSSMKKFTQFIWSWACHFIWFKPSSFRLHQSRLLLLRISYSEVVRNSKAHSNPLIRNLLKLCIQTRINTQWQRKPSKSLPKPSTTIAAALGPQNQWISPKQLASFDLWMMHHFRESVISLSSIESEREMRERIIITIKTQ